jgi:hypothetical protein
MRAALLPPPNAAVGKRLYFLQLHDAAGSLIIGSPTEPPMSHRRWLVVVQVVRTP